MLKRTLVVGIYGNESLATKADTVYTSRDSGSAQLDFRNEIRKPCLGEILDQSQPA